MSHSTAASSRPSAPLPRRSKRKFAAGDPPTDSDNEPEKLGSRRERTKSSSTARVRSAAAAADTSTSSREDMKSPDAADHPDGREAAPTTDEFKSSIQTGFAGVALPVSDGRPLWIQVPAMISELHRVMQQQLILAGDPEYDLEKGSMFMLNTESSNRMVAMMRDYLRSQVTPLYQQRRCSDKQALAFLRLLSLTLVARNESHWWWDQEDPSRVNAFMKELGHAWSVLFNGAADEDLELKNLHWTGAPKAQEQSARAKVECMLADFKKTMMEDAVNMCGEEIYRFPWPWAN